MAGLDGIEQGGPQGAEIASAWRRDHAGSGLTSRMILAYVEREAGGQAVERMLALAGLTGSEELLRDENHWFSYETKLALWSAAEEVLGDPQVAEHVGAAVLDFSVAAGLKRTLRALGTPGFVYGNVVRANAKFNWAHQLVVLDRGAARVRMRYTDVSGVGYHRYDCGYTKGLLTTVPQLFGLPRAHVAHPVCGACGGPWCDFDVRWSSGTHAIRRAAIVLAAGTVALAGAGAVADPALVPVAAGMLVAGELAVAVRAMRFMHRRLGVLELRVREQDDAAERLLSSLKDLSSDLRLDEVLDQITAKARTAVGGKEFALLLTDGDRMRADRHSGIPEPSLAALEIWAQEHRETLPERGAVLVDDLAVDPALERLPRQEGMPLGSMCAAPLGFRDEMHGVLVALAHGSTVFLPGDSAALSAYAAHAAIALSNARLVDRLERQAAEDPLTGLANRRAFYRDCAAEFSRAQRAGNVVSIVMLDLDEFKAINDAHGHPYGDQVLLGVAGALRGAIRAHDTAARMGGEEFAILLPEADADAAYDIAERARSAVARVSVAGSPLSCSAGVTTASPADASPADLLALADSALYQAKRLGRDRTVSSQSAEVVRAHLNTHARPRRSRPTEHLAPTQQTRPS
jgi:diguanylate cyclase (GGDEF)-like protein